MAEPLPLALESVAENDAPTRPAVALTAKTWWWLVGTAGGVLLLDQWAKYLIRTRLPQGEIIEVWPGWMHISHVANHGAAWGMLTGQRWLLVAVSLFVIGTVLLVVRDLGRGPLVTTGLGLVLGGALGNLVDRLWLGAVTDFIDLDTPWPPVQTFPVFNLADSALTVGVIAIMLGVMWPSRPVARL